MLESWKKLYAILTAREIRKFLVLLMVIVLMGFFELAGIASIMPFMQLVSQPGSIEDSRLLSTIYGFFELNDERQFLFALGMSVLVLLMIANALTVFTIWLQHKFAWDSAHAVANRLLKKYLGQSYEYFLTQNSSQLARQILSETNDLARGFLLSLAVLIARSFVAIVIFSLLLLVDVYLALVMFGVFGGIYGVIYMFTRKFLSGLGEERLAANELRFESANEAFWGVKMLKLSGRERYFRRRFAEASRRFCKIEPKWEATYIAPVYFIQTLAFGAILVLILYLLATERGLQDVIPLLSLYALAGYRLLPSLQQIYGAVAKVRYQRPILDSIHKDLTENPVDPTVGKILPTDAGKAFEREIAVQGLTFRYPGAEENVLSGIDLTIHKGSSVAFVGSTGSGKSTLIDIVIGLLRPTKGAVAIDGENLKPERQRWWQNLIGYVPQEIVLYDDSVARNIAFGLPDDKIDMKRVQEAARIANIHNFIVSELEEGYDTVVGERGIRLSGGQRQRIGLARALYIKPQILVLDEATSALDGVTEAAVIDGISRAVQGVTTIMIAHRLDTVKHCDHIYMMEDGRIVSEGTYQSLMQRDDGFRRLARIEPLFDRRQAAR